MKPYTFQSNSLKWGVTEANKKSHDFIDAGVKYGVYLLCSVELHLHKLSSEQTDLWVVLVYCWSC